MTITKSPRTDEADACLLAMAPELLAVLKDSLNGMDCDITGINGTRVDGLVLTREFVERINQVIAKAEGRS